MLEQLTYKQKMWAVIISGCIVLFVGYKLAINPTIAILDKINKKEAIILEAKNAPNDIKNAAQKVAYLEQKVGKTSPTFELFQKSVLNKIVPFAEDHNINIHEIKTPHFATQSNYEVQTLQIVCKATFKNSTEILDFIQKENIGRICSVNYELKKDNKTKRLYLLTTIFIQNYKKT